MRQRLLKVKTLDILCCVELARSCEKFQWYSSVDASYPPHHKSLNDMRGELVFSRPMFGLLKRHRYRIV